MVSVLFSCVSGPTLMVMSVRSTLGNRTSCVASYSFIASSISAWFDMCPLKLKGSDWNTLFSELVIPIFNFSVCSALA